MSVVRQRKVDLMGKPRLQHASMLIPPDTQESVRAFYGGLIGLEEKQPPQSLAHLHLVWFAVGEGEMELHFLPTVDGPSANDQRHICLVVEDLETYRHRLTAAGVTITEAEPIPFRPRFFCRDPFGNLVELTTIQGDYRTAE
jgi:catechol 2,3-dioxygenase-like lactoylglutathione lyase family enzyme